MLTGVYCNFISALLINSVQTLVSDLILSLNRCALLTSTSKPCLDIANCTSSNATTLCAAVCSLCNIGLGVLAGKNNAYHDPTSNPGYPDSATVGNYGITLDRCEPVVAKPFNLPCLICATEEATLANITCASPANTAAAAGPPPL